MDVARQNAIRIVIWRWYANGIHGVTLRKILPIHFKTSRYERKTIHFCVKLLTLRERRGENCGRSGMQITRKKMKRDCFFINKFE
jgi:hypothetical protein